MPLPALSDHDRDRWRTLQAANPEFASPYFTPEFAAAVASVRTDVRVAVLEDDAGGCAFWPYQRRGRTAYPVADTFNDFQAVVATDGLRWTSADLLRACGVTRLHFDHWLAGQGQVAAHAARLAASPFADLGEGYAAYVAAIAARSDQMVKVAQRRRKIAREHGAPRFTFQSRDRAALAQVIEWKAQQFRRADLPDPFAQAWTRDLLGHLLATQSEALSGWLSTLHVGDRLVAAHMGMRCRDVLHYWFPVYDREFHAYGPGLLILVEILEAAARAGVRRIDFGKGDDAWKPRFMTGSTSVAQGVLEVAGGQARWRRLGRSVLGALRQSPLRRLGAWPARRLRYMAAQRRLRSGV